MHEITDWLEKLGMAEYAQRFVENDIEISVLRYLTDQDLKDLGVSLGHRRKILATITDLNGVAPELSSPPESSVLLAARPPSVPRQLDLISGKAGGERRYLTVMFCDLVDSTSISAQLDAEDWRDLVSSYLEAASAEVIQMGGHIAKKLGDGLMVLFGYPVAQERDAERAARAALGDSACAD
jgi:class 3 adenylate cyclase